MTGTAIENLRDHADLALVVYLEELLRDRRVLLVGDTSARVERRLSDAARTVDVVVAPSAAAAGRERRARRRGLPLRAWPTSAEKGTWDAVVIPDLSGSGLADPARFDEIAALVPDGILVAAVDAGQGAPSYEAFHALVSERFEGARMLGQASLSGYALAELGASASDVAYDASSADLTPGRFVALAAPRSIAIDGYAVIATPRPPEPERASGEQKYEREAEAARTRLEHAEKRLEQAQREIARNAQKLDEARHERARLEESLRLQQAEAEAEEDRESDDVRAARDEVDAMERRLRAAAHEVTNLRAENERRGVLVRDLVEQLRQGGVQATLAAPVAGSTEADAELARAQEALRAAQRRAVDAEARRAELAFRVDELTADLASVGQAHEAATAKLRREHAVAEGSVRGLMSKVGELTELRSIAESRLALVEDDVRRSRAQSRDLERRLGELEEQLELARMQRPAPRAESAGDPGREGQLFGALLKAREELGELREERTQLLGEVARLRTALEIAAHEGDAGLAEARKRAAALELEANVRAHQLEDRNSELASVREERDTLATRVVALESVVPPPPPPVSLEALAQSEEQAREIDTLRGECAGLRMRADHADAAAEAARLAARAVEARVGASEAQARADARRAADLTSRLAARDALVSRLQSESAQASERHAASERAVSALEARLAAASESLGALEAVSSVRSDEERRERDAIAAALVEEQARCKRLDVERASALETLRDVRESLGRLSAGLGESMGASIPTAPEGVYREEIARLARDAEDRELMLRSLTAQLEERDDRIRALERVSQGDVGAVDAARLLEAEERAARLSAELAEARRARERVESSSVLVAREAELRRLEQLIGDRDAQMMLLEGRVEGASREERAMRDAFAEARAAIETILTHLGGERPADAAEHAAELLRALRKY